MDDPAAHPFSHLGGFRALINNWSLDWSLFLETTAGKTPQLSRRIDRSMVASLFFLGPKPVGASPEPFAPVSYLTAIFCAACSWACPPERQSPGTSEPPPSDKTPLASPTKRPCGTTCLPRLNSRASNTAARP